MPDKKKLITIDDLWKFERIGGLSLAPDGAQAVCAVSSFSMEDNKSVASLWLLSTFGGAPRRLTSCGEKDGQAQWSPSGEQIAFIARREQEGRKDESAQLYLIAPDGGEARRATHFAPGVGAFKWFPDGKRLAFVAWVWPELKGTKAQARRWREFQDRKATGYVTSEAQYRFWDDNLPMGRVPHLHVLDLASGRITDLFEGTAYELPRADPGAGFFDIAPDGRHLAFVHDPQAEKRIENRKTLVELQLRSGKFTALTADPDWDFDAPRYSPDGRRIAMLAAHTAQRHTAPALAAVLERGGAWSLLSDAWDHAVEAPLRWSADAAALYFCAQDRGRNHLYRYAIASRTASVALQGGWVQAFDVAGGVIVASADTLMHPARVHAVRDGQAPLRLDTFNDALLATLRLGDCEEVTFKGALGEPVQMWLTYPPRFDSKKKHPVLHSIHGGPHAAAGDTFHYRWNTHAFAAQGYVVACVNYHGSSGFGQAFLDSITHRWGELELQDVEAGSDWLLKQPWADRKRLFAAGGSYGGFMVAWMNGHVKAGRYNAYVCHAGCFDWQAMFSDDAYTWHAKELGCWYWDDPLKIQAQSPSHFVAAMATPTLVIHGARDYRVPDQQGLAYYNTLKAKGVDARLLWFPDENHWVLKPRNSQLWYAEFFDWLRRHDPHARKAAPHGRR
ncbi:S9 family peptidase [Rhizobacter sp. Root404]|uniref:S9 family peptidase n=1 Tax=Rhizobacter sp. Root404 TaxID=1736528 RepID=UPI000701D613|nr:S9 family peptidase [Rhizobacter sp. Root404]KQW40402.1 peptidase S9 [Rhizobacter sp. Root404]